MPSTLEAQEPVQLPPAAKPAPSETPRTPTVNADSFANGIVRTFKPEQFSALEHLADLIAPSSEDSPGAADAKTAEFLDFLVGQSPADRIALYRGGLDALNAQARQRYQNPFAQVTAAEAATILSPLREPWSYREPAALLPRFLLAAKEDILRATLSSREYITVVSQRRRNAGGSGQYWYPVD